MFWVTNDIIVLFFKNSIQLIAPNNQKESLMLEGKAFYCRQEIDGLKIVSNISCGLLRKIPESYRSIFAIVSFEPGYSLYQAYESFENRNPMPDSYVQSDTANLIRAVEDCVKAAEFELDFPKIKKLLMAASFGKAFLGPDDINHNIIKQASLYLKVVYQLQNELHFRTITLEQLREIKEDVLISILLRYKKHFLAHEICNHLQYSKHLQTRILIDWASCKIEAERPEDELVEIIKNKL